MVNTRQRLKDVFGEIADVLYADKQQALRALNAPSPDHRCAAICVINWHWKVDQESLPLLLHSLEQELVAKVRRSLVSAIGTYYYRNTTDVLVRQILLSISKDPKEDVDVQNEACFALQRPTMSDQELTQYMRDEIERGKQCLEGQ